ncbi:AAA family ATPase [Paraburkholderia youngii]|uniref:AAA family ATPase n=1 Tax=Paraburkholderia youngii TaxID=2782701 RepID=UPI003D1AC5B5
MDAQDFSRLAREISSEDRLRYSRLNRDQVYALSPQEKLRFFFSLQVRHAKLRMVEARLNRCLAPFSEERLIFLVGPTGAGKTSFSEYFLGAELASEEAGKIPFIMIKVPALGPRKIPWSGLYRDMLHAGGEPLIDSKRASFVQDGRLQTVPASQKSALFSLREAVVSMLDNRGTLLVALDEAFHLLRSGDPVVVMDSIKSLADAAPCQFLLIGSYDLLEFVNSYAQIGRRGGLIYFDRYRAKIFDKIGNLVANVKDVEDFGKGIRKLETRWPLESRPDFYAAREILLEATLGIFGLLKEFMMNCLDMQLKNGGKWQKGFIKESLKSAYAINAIREEVEKGEERLTEMGYGCVALSDEKVETLTKLMTGSMPVEE